MLMEIKKKKLIILEDEMSDWVQSWMAAASLLDIKDNKVIVKTFVFLANWLVFLTITYSFIALVRSLNRSVPHVSCNESNSLLMPRITYLFSSRPVKVITEGPLYVQQYLGKLHQFNHQLSPE